VGGTGSLYGGTIGTGGIVGYLVENCRMYNCSNYGSVGSCSTTAGTTGGLCGVIAAIDSRVANCYNSGVVTLKTATVSGGLAGRVAGYLLNCYNAAERTSSKMGTLAGSIGTNSVIKGCSTLSSNAFVYNKTLSVSNYNSSNKTLEKAISLTSPYGLNTKMYSGMSAFTYITDWVDNDNKFAANTVTIELYENGTDKATSTITVSEGSTYSTLKNLSDTSFIGWYTTPTGGSHQITSNSIVALSLESSVTEGKKLYARYSSSDSVAENTVLGDYDGDKKLTKKDAALLLEDISVNGVNVEYKQNLDMNDDSKINILDVIQIMKKIEQ
jgi:hypothetical protein